MLWPLFVGMAPVILQKAKLLHPVPLIVVIRSIAPVVALIHNVPPLAARTLVAVPSQKHQKVVRLVFTLAT